MLVASGLSHTGYTPVGPVISTGTPHAAASRLTVSGCGNHAVFGMKKGFPVNPENPWRRSEGDSNPRAANAANTLAGCPFRPLRHHSSCVLRRNGTLLYTTFSIREAIWSVRRVPCLVFRVSCSVSTTCGVACADACGSRSLQVDDICGQAMSADRRSRRYAIVLPSPANHSSTVNGHDTRGGPPVSMARVHGVACAARTVRWDA